MSELTQSIDKYAWNTLSYVPLVSIFQYLDYEDRFNASLVCRDWSIAFECPTLWKEINLIFSGDMVDDSRKAILFAKKHATSIKILKMQFRRNNETRLSEVLSNMQLLFEYLFSSKLHSFELENFLQPHQASHPSLFRRAIQVMDAFKGFIGNQMDLQKLALYNVRFLEKYGLDILILIAKRNKSLKELGLVHFFEEDLDVYSNPIFQNLLKSFSNLQVLNVSYQCISTEIIEILCDNCSNPELQELSVACSFREGLRHRIPNQNWSILRRTFPDILISFEIVEVVTQRQFESLVLPATQLNVFSYKCGFTLQTEQNLRRHGTAILRYLGHNFSDYLRNIRLDFGFVGIPSLERAILSLLRNCKVLNKIVLSGVLRSVVAIRVCEIALQPESELTDILLVFFFTSIESIDAIIRLQEYKRQLKEKGVNFDFNLLVS